MLICPLGGGAFAIKGARACYVRLRLARGIERFLQLVFFSTHELSVCTIDIASRVGLTPSPTCQSGQGGLPQGDVAQFGNEAGCANCQPSSPQPKEGFACLMTKIVHLPAFLGAKYRILRAIT
jgi:hypothetical protein